MSPVGRYVLCLPATPFYVAPLTFDVFLFLLLLLWWRWDIVYCRPSDEEVALSRMLDKVLRRSDAVDKEGLCILAGQRVCFLYLYMTEPSAGLTRTAWLGL